MLSIEGRSRRHSRHSCSRASRSSRRSRCSRRTCCNGRVVGGSVDSGCHKLSQNIWLYRQGKRSNLIGLNSAPNLKMQKLSCEQPSMGREKYCVADKVCSFPGIEQLTDQAMADEEL